MRVFKSACGAAALIMAMAVGARADENNKLTYLTFSGAVQLPGKVLPAGTYAFKLLDSSDRRVVQVTDKAGKMSMLLLTIPNQRMKPADKPVIMFKEQPSGQQPAVQAWFYPGETYGYEFVYPRSQAIKIAKASHTPVAAIADETKSDDKSLSSAKVAHVDENGKITEEGTVAENRAPEPAPAAQSAPSRSTSAAATVSPAPVGTSGAAAKAPRRQLPRTASPLELMELLSGLSLTGAFGVRQLKRRVL